MSSEHVTDSLGRVWQLGPLLGRGTWGQSRSIRDAAGREAVLKVPLGAGEGGDPAVCAAIAREQLAFAQDHAFGAAAGARVQSPRVEATVALDGGAVGVIHPRYSTLERRLEQGLPLSEALAIAHRIAASLADAQRAHGNLKPSNVWFGERGEVLLADPCTATALARAQGLRAAEGFGRAFLPPEAGAGRMGPTHDTWALCQVLWTAISSQRQPAGGGVDKLALTTAKDRAHAAFSTEGSNPRFRGRVADRLGALLSRGLSPDRAPSPPYRFESLRELADRLAEVLALLRPRVVDVGRLLPPASARDAVFTDPKGIVGFSITVGGTPGVSDADDLVCGLLLTDLDKNDEDGRPLRVPVDDADVDVQTHPSGRLRFQFSVPGVPPGRYRLRVAFAVKDSGDEPQVATTDFEVRPPPGYVPPAPAPAAPQGGALPFPRAAKAAPAPASDPPTGDPASDPGRVDRRSDPGSDPGLRPAGSVARSTPRPATAGDEDTASAEEPAAEVVRFPRPIAPPEDDREPARPVVRRTPVSFPEPSSDPDSGGSVPRLEPLSAPPVDDEVLDTEELLADTADGPSHPGASAASNVIPLPSVSRPPTPPPPPVGSVSRPPPEILEVGSEPVVDDAASEDLPGYGRRETDWRAAARALVEWLRRDRFLSVGVAAVLCLLVVLLLTILLKAC